MAMSRANMNKEVQKAPSSPKAQKKIERVMGEYKRGKLKSSSGQKVKSRDQAIAIALSEARGAMQRKYGGKDITMYKDSVDRRFGKGGPSTPTPRTPSREEQAAESARIAREKQERELQRVRDEEMRKRTQEAYERTTGRKLPK